MTPNQILYISYDGMTDSLGRSQVLPYLCALSEKGWRITLISAEKPEVFAQGESEVRGIVNAAEIDYNNLGESKTVNPYELFGSLNYAEWFLSSHYGQASRGVFMLLCTNPTPN